MLLRRSLAFAFAAAAVVSAVATAVLTYDRADAESDKVRAILASGERRSLLQDLMTEIRDAEIGQYGSRLADLPAPVEALQVSLAKITHTGEEIGRAYLEGPVDAQDRVRRLRAATDRWVADLTSGGSGRKDPRLTQAMATEIAELVRIENQALRQLERDGDRHGSTTGMVAALGAALSSVFMLASLTLFGQLLAATRRTEAHARRQAMHDPLTGLPNRLSFQDKLEFTLRRSRREGTSSSVLYIDLDKFKPINDRHGHAVGDELLCRVAAAMNTTIRESDIASRLGGDEFAVLVPRIDLPQDAQHLAQRILTALHRVSQEKPEWSGLSASIGIAIFPDDGPDAEHMVRHADHAMYEAKRQGGRRYHSRSSGKAAINS